MGGGSFHSFFVIGKSINYKNCILGGGAVAVD